METIKISGTPAASAFTSGRGATDAPERRPDVHRDFRRADHCVVRGARPDPEGGGAAVNLANIVGLILCTATALFLVAALLFPERF